MNKKSFRKYNKRYKKTSKKFSRKIKKRIFGGNPTIINIALNETYIKLFEDNIIELISKLIVNNIQKPEGMMYSWVSYLNKNINEINNLKQDILNDIIDRMPILFVIKDLSFYTFQLKNNNKSHNNNNKLFFKNLKSDTTENNYSVIEKFIRSYYTLSKDSIENNDSVTEFQIDEKLNNLNKLYSIIDATEKRFRGKIPENVLNNFENIKQSIFNFKTNINVDYVKRNEDNFNYTTSNSSNKTENELNKLKEDLLNTKNKLLACESINNTNENNMPKYPPPPPPKYYK